MSRCLPYRVECTEKCLQAQNDALSSTFFILRQTGPTAFVIKEDSERTFKVFLGDPHQCTCSSFQTNREICKHICWLLLKRFRVPRTNPILWQRGLVEREINELLRELTQDNDERNRSKFNYRIKDEDENDADRQVEQRPISENDVCPICQEELLNKKLPVTHCRRGCGNNVHVKCMKIWLDHQVSTGEKLIKCPLCRETFGTPEQLKLEFQEIGAQRAERASIHLGHSCHRCHACPITDKCYKCTTCQDYFLCQTCFNLNIHNEHSFDYREKSFQHWKIATREHLAALPNALHRVLANRDINENDYEILRQLENAQNAAIMGVPENVVKSMPTERINEHSQLLQNCEQCRLCLRLYQKGERVRRLPCRHKFHIDCIDGWLLHSHCTCPIDGQLVWSADMTNEHREIKRPSSAAVRKSKKNIPPATNSPLLSVNMGLTIVPYQVRTSTHTDLNHQFRRFHMGAPLRPLIAPKSMEFSQLRAINSQILPNSQSNLSLSQDVDQRQFRRQSLLSSPSLRTENISRVNIEFNQYSTSSTNIFNHRLRQRSCSSAK
ncbi:unnamed protein product [Rotaria magnacalcarata]|uniref:E3 ubiquitin-protein ligase ZSWIM2 n=1 Tax=Rotaria magnacalcarata TaxID=392030 RepID=A0A816Z526_9BILA|nr:unnamed protein product [Rotaria magnacalcarata]CAF1430483.1 unnamed protein product [Rotaria magnacalcarata]CAF2080722.1 unnamed protein product [Rotaria magnacalcarata]CAF2185771.1 unnamed protein product [Rotaria magnacalcarata]CAF2219079.1 unnamed protein product [Rotaria magnacalcarata]